MIFSTYVSRMEAANMKLNAYIKAGTRAILAFSESVSNILNPYYPIVMSRKEFRKILKGTGLEKYEITERLFPKKKKRGSMRRVRIERKWGKFNDSSIIPPISREEFMQKASFSAPLPGPFEGEEENL